MARLPRNREMANRVEMSPVAYPFTFVVVGDSGAWRDPTAEAIFSAIVSQIAQLDPAPVFLAHLGDFAGPGTATRHEKYLSRVEHLEIPNLVVLGNHELDDAEGVQAFERFHGPATFDFGHGHTRFFVIRSVPGTVGEMDIPREGPLAGLGPRDQDLDALERHLREAEEPNRVILMHMPPDLDGRFAPHEEWGFTRYEDRFMRLLDAYNVTLVCTAHGLAFDTVVRDRVRFVMSGGGGTGLCSHFRGICSIGSGTPEDRGALFHFVVIALSESGAISGRVVQAFASDDDTAAYSFGRSSDSTFPDRS